MKCLYHFVPENMKGETLFPLNQLKGEFPEIYAKEAQKYVGREIVMQKSIPFLDCLWNDVLHLTAVPPKRIKEELEKAGKKTIPFRYFKIDPSTLDASRAIIYLYRSDLSRGDQMREENFVRFNIKTFSQYGEISDATRTHYKAMAEKKERPFVFLYVPHILYKGTIDVSGLEIIEV